MPININESYFLALFYRLIPVEEDTQALRGKMEARRRLKKKRSRDTSAGVDQMGEAGTKKLQITASSEGSSKCGINKPGVAISTSVSSRPVNVSLTKGSSNAAAVSVAKKEDSSDVYKKLFHTDKDGKASSRDLMMSTAGFRYGLS